MPSTQIRQFSAALKARPYWLAVACMIISTGFFSLMNVCIREANTELHTTVIVCLRNGIALILMAPFLWHAGPSIFHTKRMKSHFWRATVGILGMQAWFYCVTTLPLNNATALSFTAPLFTTLFAVIFLKEQASSARWAAMFAGFLGTLVILQPNPHSFDWNAMVVMLTTSIWAVAGMLVKSLTRTEPPLRIIFYMALFMFLWAIPPAALNWSTPDTKGWLLLTAVAFCSTAAHWALVKAYALAGVVQIMPYDFSRLLWTALFAWFFFGEESQMTTWLGAAIIVGSVVFIARRDAKAAPIV